MNDAFFDGYMNKQAGIPQPVIGPAPRTEGTTITTTQPGQAPQTQVDYGVHPLVAPAKSRIKRERAKPGNRIRRGLKEILESLPISLGKNPGSIDFYGPSKKPTQ